MKRIKGLLKIALVIIMPIMLMMSTGDVSFATTDTNPYYVMLYNGTNEQRPTGFYWVKTENGNNKPVIKLVKTNAQGTNNTSSEVIYCLDNAKGFGSQGETTTKTVLDYKKYYDMRKPSEIPSADKLAIPFSSSNYNSLMWLLDNIAIDDESKASLSAAFENSTDYTIQDFSEYTMPISDKNKQVQDILESVQQSAIWRLIQTNSAFQPAKPTDFSWTQYRNDSLVNHTLDGDYYDDFTGPARYFYNYLVETANAHSSYDYTKNGSSPLTYVKGFDVAPSCIIKGANYLVGPYNITNAENSNLVNLEVTIPNGAKITDINGNELSGATNADKIKSHFGTDFYILMPISNLQTVLTITVKPTYSVRTINYRITESNSNFNQPIVNILNENKQEEKTSTVTLVPPTFDLSLRKFISGVENSNKQAKIDTTTVASLQGRTPTLELDTLLENTTATYKHRKDPITVENGDYVKYTLRIYNEGQLAGRALQVTDQLPEGLEFNEIVSGVFEQESYDTTTNKLVLKRMQGNTENLPGYTGTGTTLNSEDIVIRCKVTATAGRNSQTLTNVAWISDQVNQVGDVITDRDSTPSTAPNVNKNNMADYKGNNNKDELADPNYYYKGFEDDDDFEKLNIEPAPSKEFDLALRKFITKIVSQDGTERTSIRNVQVNETPISTVQTAEYKHAKNPIEVQTGDTVYYSLRIYNEGEAAGRATEITDRLPEGVVLDESQIIVGNFEIQSYNTSNNTLVLKRKTGNTANLPAYSTGSLQENGQGHETIVIPCKVTATPDTANDKVLTNIAWISEEYNADTGETIKSAANKDRDSVPSTHPEYSNDWKGTTSETFENLSKQIYFPGQQDDDDFEKIVIKPVPPRYFDLALRKFITEVKDSEGNTKAIQQSREPQITPAEQQKLGTDTATFDNGTTAEKDHTKQKLLVNTGDIVTYTIRVYNEGQVDGYASKITDYIPAGLEFVAGTTNNNAWNYNQATRQATTKNAIQLHAYNPETNTLDAQDVKIDCRVTAQKVENNNLKNIAEITETSNEENLPDRDSPNLLDDNKKNNYNPENSERGKGYEDDDDFEDLDLPELYFDLALRKFITEIKHTDGTTKTIEPRTPTITTTNISDLANKNASGTHDNGKTAIKAHSKTPLTVSDGDKVKYTIRIYNEGDVNGTATKVTDFLPEGLRLASNSETNIRYGWTADSSDTTGRTVTTTYLSDRNIDAFNGQNIDSEDLEIECEVVGNGITSKHLKNVAEITETRNDANILADRDSTVNNLTNKGDNYNVSTSERGKGYEDDDDYEDLLLIRFDLALRKFITEVKDSEGNTKAIQQSREPQITPAEQQKLGTDTATFDNGTTAEKDHTKQKLLVNTGDIVTYTIRVYNEGQVDGYASKITDYIPAGLEFVEGTTNNSEWDYNQATRQATTKSEIRLNAYNPETNTLDAKDVKIDCRVTAQKVENNNLKNIAEITDTRNDENLPDRDSPNLLDDNKKNNYNPENSERGKGYEDDDDFEDLDLPELYFDLALRKFITEIKHADGTTKTIEPRTPTINARNIRDLANENADGTHDNGKTAIKVHSKTPLTVSKGDKVKYTIRIYNEGNVNGTATKVTDFLPEGLRLASNSETNTRYGWTADSSDTTGRTVTTTYLSDRNIDAFNGQNIDSEDLEIECEVVGSDITSKHLKNVAEITETRNDANISADRDSTVNNLTNKGDNYNVSTSERGKGYEDDDDYEDLLLIRFDLALRKFITGVNNQNYDNRIPRVDPSKLGTLGEDGKEITSFTYDHPKDPVRVEQNQIVTYTIRVYNEGTVDGYAEVIKDDIPEGLEFLPDHDTNKNYLWTMLDESGNVTTDVTKAKSIATDYRSKARSQTDNLIRAFNKDTMQTPDFKDVKVAFKVKEPNTSDRIIINQAQISRHSDKDGNTDIKDIDSTPDVWNEGEDDQDIEKIYVKYFDLSLRKWVTHKIVIEDGVQKEEATLNQPEDDPEKVAKVELNKKRLEETVVKFRYSIRVTNEGEIAGYATEISDYIPDGLRFNQADNPEWTERDGKVVTDQLKDTLLQPGESKTIEILLTWINSESNMGIKVNVAEISADYNESGTPDIDSIPDNQKDGEDDIDDAPVALTVVAGSAPTYIAIASGITLIIGAGVFFIKKYVI